MNATSNESTWTNCRPNDKPISSYGFEKNELVLPFSLSFQIHRFLFQERNIRADRDMKEFQTRHLRDEDRAHEARREHIRLSRHIVSEWQGKRKTIHDRLSSSIYQLEPVRNLNHSPDNRPDGSSFFLSFARCCFFLSILDLMKKDLLLGIRCSWIKTVLLMFLQDNDGNDERVWS